MPLLQQIEIKPEGEADALTMGYGFRWKFSKEAGSLPLDPSGSAYVVTQKDMEGRADIDDAVGLASYGVDEWPYAMVPLDGKIALMGGYYSMLYLEEANRGIYKIPYRAIVPHKKESENLLVPVCLSASHIAMTSIRMEPVWMILGESAGVAAAMAVRGQVPVQSIAYGPLRERLLGLEQRLDIPARPAPG